MDPLDTMDNPVKDPLDTMDNPVKIENDPLYSESDFSSSLCSTPLGIGMEDGDTNESNLDIKIKIETQEDETLQESDNDQFDYSDFVTCDIKEETNSELEIESETQVCRGCGHSFKQLLRHINHGTSGKSCKEFYTSEELQPSNKQKKYYEKNREKLQEKRRIREKVEKKVCRGCEHSFKKLLLHLNHSDKGCREFYTSEELQPVNKQKMYYERNKEKLKEKHKEYYEKNKEKSMSKERMSSYYEQNKEKIKKKNSDRYEKNKEKDKERRNKYYEENRERIKQRMAERYEKNKEREKERRNKYYEDNKEKIKEKNNKRYEEERKKQMKENYLKQRLATKHKPDIKTKADSDIEIIDDEIEIIGEKSDTVECKVMNCMAIFWFQSQLDKHMKNVHFQS